MRDPDIARLLISAILEMSEHAAPFELSLLGGLILSYLVVLSSLTIVSGNSYQRCAC